MVTAQNGKLWLCVLRRSSQSYKILQNIGPVTLQEEMGVARVMMVSPMDKDLGQVIGAKAPRVCRDIWSCLTCSAMKCED